MHAHKHTATHLPEVDIQCTYTNVHADACIHAHKANEVKESEVPGWSAL